MGFLEKLLSSVLSNLISRLFNWFKQAADFFMLLKKSKDKIDIDTAIHQSIIDESRADGVISDAEKEKIKQGHRDIVRGTFDK